MPNALKTRILEEIALSGPMPLARYMTLCLTDPDYGYYTRRDPLGRLGDFTTAPEVSQMFGEMIGIWVRRAYEQLGRPSKLRLMELGPGRGTLMADCTRALRSDPALCAALEICMVDISPVLQGLQRQALADAPCPVSWHERIPISRDMPTLIIANEFLDALPVHVLIRTENGMAERHVQAAGGELSYIDLPSAMAVPASLKNMQTGTIVEISPPRHEAIQAMAGAITPGGGAALIIDYGYSARRNGTTFQALKDHQHVDPLQDPGEADLTALVDFQAAQASFRTAGLLTSPVQSQMDFLLDHGLLERAAALGRHEGPDVQAKLQADVNRLVSPDEMGTLFKVLIASTSKKLIAIS